jgi:hypothetical protein
VSASVACILTIVSCLGLNEHNCKGPQHRSLSGRSAGPSRDHRDSSDAPVPAAPTAMTTRFSMNNGSAIVAFCGFRSRFRYLLHIRPGRCPLMLRACPVGRMDPEWLRTQSGLART